MSTQFDHIAVGGIAFDFNRHGGSLRNFTVTWKDGPAIRPLHTAPWVDKDEQLPDGLAVAERNLSGDFFCAPFGASGGPPIHGRTANGHWHPAGSDDGDGSAIRQYRLDETVYGAVVTKTLELCAGHPFLYQRHRFEGGEGHFPVAHHAMIRVPGGAKLSFSNKQFGVTPDASLEADPARGHSMLAYPQTFERLNDVKATDGKSVDASVYPFSKAHEDIIILASERDARIGWSAALAKEDGFLFFAIKDASALPETILWMSNGGRHYAPWSGRHTCVLGIEEAATSCHHNRTFGSTGEMSPHGLATGLSLEASAVRDIRYGFGAIPVPDGWSDVVDIRVGRTSLTLEDVSGAEISLPFNGAHFGL